MYCATDLCLTATKLKKGKKENTVGLTDVSVYVVHIPSTVEKPKQRV